MSKEFDWPPSGTAGRREGAIWFPGVELTPDHGPDEASTQPCPFCALQPDQILAVSEHAVAIRDAYPSTDSHALILPRRHIAAFFDLDAAERQDVWALADRVREDLLAGGGIDGFTIGINDGPVAGQTVPHAHLHVIPRRTGDVPDPRGGIRWVLPETAAYWEQ